MTRVDIFTYSPGSIKRVRGYQSLYTYHCLVKVQFVGRVFVGRRHGGRPVHAVVYLVERVETRAGVSVRYGFAQQLADLDGVCC